MEYTFLADKALEDLLNLPEVEKDEQGEEIYLASRILEADKLSDVEDISSEKILALLPKLSDVFYRVANVGEQQKKDREKLVAALPFRKKRKLL